MSDQSPDPAVARRRVLQLAGAGGAGVLLTACGSSSDDTDDAAVSTTTPATTETSAASGAGDSADVVAAVADVPVGGGVIGTDLVVTQPTAGAFKAFSKVCTHQGCPVSSITGDKILCNCHNSQFSIKDGSVVQGPATKALSEVAVKVSGTNVVKA
ncbi:Rieske (2Fe-2S) protein [Actinoplanes palleronii]|uniref:Cytochrome bc1 complex Rieske iron-sulfur subunit n=1 Tax=Actinoplanes palleronii TaxID=113570 RepID=A0ABQ4BG59_9ACTN|nr:Rieske (2Fe-2S) protein [Actinoplanes palleronii]GIE69632.1 hypothetical protein Apa02nite_057400 [Actinoplanes palleronii]